MVLCHDQDLLAFNALRVYLQSGQVDGILGTVL